VDEDPVLLQVKAGVATITLNRPDRHNAVGEMTEGLLYRYLDLARADREVRAVVLRANGPSFSSGRDAAEAAEHHPGTPDFDRVEHQQWCARLLHELPVPTICALRGWVLGLGFEWALLCDIRIAADSAKLALTGIDHGTVGEAAGVARLFEIGGSALALDLALTGRRLSALEALRYGLVSRVVADDDLDDVVDDTAHAIADRPPLVVRLVREHVRALAAAGVDGTLRRELVSQTLVRSSRGPAEPRAANGNDREPRVEHS